MFYNTEPSLPIVATWSNDATGGTPRAVPSNDEEHGEAWRPTVLLVAVANGGRAYGPDSAYSLSLAALT